MIMNILKNIQNLTGFIIGNYSLFVYLYSLKEQTTYISLLKTLNTLVLKHSAVELVTSKKYDIIVHRLCSVAFSLYLQTKEEIFSTILYAEIPTIFYILKKYIDDPHLYNANYVLFYLTFFKFKIYDFYTILNDFDIGVLCIYTQYIINLYWFLLMNKHLYENFMQPLNNLFIKHSVCRYIHFVNVPLTIYMYSYDPCKRYIYDIVGITVLSASSYQYHNDFYNKLNKVNDSFTENDAINNLLFESVCVHLRSWLSILTSYYHVKNLFLLLIVSGVFHLYSMFLSNMNVLQLFINDGEVNVFIKCHKIILSVPVLCDYLLIFMNSPNEIAIPYLLIIIIGELLIFVKPFGKLNEIAFQTLLIGQTYYYCLSNLNSIYH